MCGAAGRRCRDCRGGQMTSVAQAGTRIEELLASLRSRGGAAAETAEELVRLLVGMYGEGLAAIMAALAEEGEPGRAIAGAVRDAAPEVSEVVVEGMTAPPGPALLQIGPRPDEVPGGGLPAGAGGGEWVLLPDIGPPSSRPVTAAAGGLTVLVCAVRGTLYAYRDECASCDSPLGEGRLDREVLTCPCGSRYDVCRAGAGLDGLAAHLDPLPLLADSQGVRVAVPAAVPS